MLQRAWRPILEKCGGDLARNVARGYMLAAPICLLFPTLRFTFFDLIFAFHTNVSNFVVIFVVQIAASFMFEIINLLTMQPIPLPLISQATFGRQSRQHQNLINALTSENNLLRVNF
jgi:hypothetical protein